MTPDAKYKVHLCTPLAAWNKQKKNVVYIWIWSTTKEWSKKDLCIYNLTTCAISINVTQAKTELAIYHVIH